MSRVNHILYINLIISFGALMYIINPFLCSHGYKSNFLYTYLFLFYVKIFYLASFMATMHNYPILLVIHIVAFLYSLYITYFLSFMTYLSRHNHIPVRKLPHLYLHIYKLNFTNICKNIPTVFWI